jgi:hypothetical protein
MPKITEEIVEARVQGRDTDAITLINSINTLDKK